MWRFSLILNTPAVALGAPARPRFRHLQRVLAALAVLAGMLIFARARWLPPIGAFLIVADPVAHADAIVPLAGERARVTYAAALLKQNAASAFVITDMWIPGRSPTYTYAAMIQLQAAREGVAGEQIVVAPGVAASTYEEALNLRQLAQSNGWRSLTVVTSPYHTRRARIILTDLFRGSGVKLAIVPVANHWYQPQSWWRSWQGWQITLSEYCKLALYFMGYHRVFN